MASLPSADGGAMKAPQHVLAPQHATPGGSGRLDRPWRPLPQSWEARQRGGGPVQAQDSEHGYPFGSDPLDKRFPSAEGLPLSLYTPYDELPPDGQIQTDRELSCDPMHQMCQWNGADGVKIQRTKPFVFLHSVQWIGYAGYVRRTTARFIPEVNGSGPMMTLNRPKEQEELPPELRNGALRKGFKKKD